MPKRAIIDLEFTGLDNYYCDNHEIIQVKVMNIETGNTICANFNSKRPISAHPRLEHKCLHYSDHPFFSKAELENMLQTIDLELYSTAFYGFGVEMDLRMLYKYDVDIDITDIRSAFQKSEFALQMAVEGSSLEATYLIVTDKYPENISHADASELTLIYELYLAISHTYINDFMEIVPFGPWAGSKISDYVVENRRKADGYRFNNDDEFATALDHAIHLLQSPEEDDRQISMV